MTTLTNFFIFFSRHFFSLIHQTCYFPRKLSVKLSTESLHKIIAQLKSFESLLEFQSVANIVYEICNTTFQNEIMCPGFL